MIREITLNDAQAVADIYNYYIENTVVTFEETAVSAEEIKQRILAKREDLPWIVFEKEGVVVGYAYASEWKSRCAYKFSIESTVYLKNTNLKEGIGTLLYTELIDRIKKTNVHAIIGGIALPNDGSTRLHEKLGFEKVAQFREVGYKFDQWIDVGYWELIL
ncbi:arsinothricin resistance N-acetyltransferase ArsN1 family B [Flammeovirga sp. EKP202]|uniref:arsinothricin resistance N-acetyltransferase ArsN1 family B n=1 Tax=Flammeovirga sp. EKP202 TaxID=2770592 RepID=UPI00165F6F9B|nr:arsinothricin resistance N-acetyltransferase ArsN1 family B [Flammeovirga sp. EKP202]MBD0401581.1 N-acetyltransferase family protein [Flammeovirga sp. EKP202]